MATGRWPRWRLRLRHAVSRAFARVPPLPAGVPLPLLALLLCAALLLQLRTALPSRAQSWAFPQRLPSCKVDASGGRQQHREGSWSAGAVVIVSTYPPTHCGLATFASDLRAGLLSSGAVTAVDVVAVHTGPPGSAAPRYPPEVCAECLPFAARTCDSDTLCQVTHVVRKHVAADYTDAAAVINAQARRPSSVHVHRHGC